MILYDYAFLLLQGAFINFPFRKDFIVNVSLALHLIISKRYQKLLTRTEFLRSCRGEREAVHSLFLIHRLPTPLVRLLVHLPHSQDESVMQPANAFAVFKDDSDQEFCLHCFQREF